MGAAESMFSAEELEAYEHCTCLFSDEIITLQEKFNLIGGKLAGQKSSKKDEEISEDEFTEVKAKMSRVVAQEEFANNPFRCVSPPPDRSENAALRSARHHSCGVLLPLADRLCQIFSSEPADSPSFGDLGFDEFVDLYSCLSQRASREDKMQTAFRMYDIDNNGYISSEDLEQVLALLSTAPPKDGTDGEPKGLLTPDEISSIVSRVMRTCDVDGNSRLSYLEFTKMVERVPQFAANFSLNPITVDGQEEDSYWRHAAAAVETAEELDEATELQRETEREARWAKIEEDAQAALQTERQRKMPIFTWGVITLIVAGGIAGLVFGLMVATDDAT